MNKKYYNSVEWGIQKENVDKIREKGFEFLREIGCKTCNNYALKIQDISKNTEKAKKVFDGSTAYLVVFESSNKKKEKKGKFNVKDINELYEIINSISSEDWQEYTVSCIEQIQYIENSFSGTALSDGNGKLLIEFILGTTDSRELTSRGANANKIDYCYYSDFETISRISTKIPLELIENIKQNCHFFKGYYEFVYGKSKGNPDIFFTFYSDIPEYRNLLKNQADFSSQEISSRLKYNYIQQKKYCDYSKLTKEDLKQK